MIGPVMINTRILMLTMGVNPPVIAFISLLVKAGDSKDVLALGNITRRIIHMPPIQTTVATTWRKWLTLTRMGIILQPPLSS